MSEMSGQSTYNPSMRASTIRLLVILFTMFALACGGGGGGGGGPAIRISWITPVVDLEVEPGAQVILKYIDDDLNGVSDVTTTLYAVPVDLASETVQINTPRPHGGGTVQTVLWSTNGVPKGRYRLEARSTDSSDEVSAFADGYVAISDLPIVVTSPANDPFLSRGGFLTLAFTALFPNEAVLLTWFVDRDGSLATDSDQIVIAADIPDADGSPQQFLWDASGVPVGLYRVFVRVQPPSGDPVTLQLKTRIQFGSVACAGSIGTVDTDSGLDIGSFPAFLAKFQSNCTLAWVKSAANDTSSALTKVRTWPDGSLLTYGATVGSVTLGLGETNQTSMPTGPFLARFNSDGTLAWARSTFVPTGATLVDFDTIPGGDYVVTGIYTGTVTFSNGSLNVNLTSAGGTDLFMARYNPTGQMIWARTAGGTGTDLVYAVRTRPDGSSLALGEFSAPITFGITEPNFTTFSPLKPLDSWVANFQANGNLAWATGGQVPLLGAAGGVDMRFGAFPDGAFVIAGPLVGSGRFALGTAEDRTVSTPGSTLFVARFGTDQKLQWVRLATDGSGIVRVTDLATFPPGAVALVGDVVSSALFAPGLREETTLPAGGFRAAWRASASLAFVYPADVRATSPLSVAGFVDGSFVVGGEFFGTVTFGAGTPQEKTLVTPYPTRTWDSDAYAAKYNADGGF